MTTSNEESDWNELWGLFHDALELEETERRSFLDQACGDDSERRGKLEKLLVAHGLVDEARLPNLEPLLDVDEAAAPAASEDPAPGDKLGPYEIEEQIGEGGMGVVYRARQLEPVQRCVALKILQYGMATRDIIARFNAERQALAMMSHSNIARIFDAGTTDAGRPYFVLEYVPGCPVTDYSDNRKLDIDGRLRLFLDICDGVQHAHQKGIIHRDIKPSNVLVTEENGLPVPKIIDFGIAKATEQHLSEETLYTRVGTLIGTPGYMSPEQAGVVPLDIDSRADVYSLGVLLYELLVGVQPFESTSTARGLFEIQQAIRDEEPQRPSHRLSRVPEDEGLQISRNRAMRPLALQRRLDSDVEWILLKAVDKNRERRYQSVSELAADIRRYADGLPVLARAPTRRYKASKFVRRHVVGVTMTAIVSMLILAFAGTMTVQSLRLQRALDQTTLERNRAEQVSDFMVDLFEAANPEVAGTTDITAQEMLAQGSSRLQSELTNQPELRARLLMTVGETYRVLGGADNSATAISLLEQALTDVHSLDPPPPDQQAALLNSLGAVHHDEGDFDQAESNYQRSLALLESDEGSKLKSDILGNLSVLLTDRGNLSEAEDYARASLAIQKNLAGFRDPEVARLQQRLAYIVYQQGDIEEAQELIAETLSVLREYYGASHPFVATALNYAAIIQRGGGDPLAAQRSLRNAAEIYRETYGDDHPYLANTLSNLALAYNQTGDLDKAAEALAEALRVGIANYGIDHPNVNTFRINLGTNLQDMGRLVEAEPLLREGLKGDRESLDPGSPYLIATLDRLGATLGGLGKYDEAELLLREAVVLRREYRGSSDAETGVAILNLALNRLAQGSRDDAERLAIESVDIQRSLTSASDPLAQSLAGLSYVRYSQGRNTDARALLQESLDMFGPATDKTVLSKARAWALLAEIESESGNLDDAQHAYDAADAVLRKHVPDEHPDLVRLQVARDLLICRTTASSKNIDVIRLARPLLARAVGEAGPGLANVDNAIEQCLEFGKTASP